MRYRVVYATKKGNKRLQIGVREEKQGRERQEALNATDRRQASSSSSLTNSSISPGSRASPSFDNTLRKQLNYTHCLIRRH